MLTYYCKCTSLFVKTLWVRSLRLLLGRVTMAGTPWFAPLACGPLPRGIVLTPVLIAARTIILTDRRFAGAGGPGAPSDAYYGAGAGAGGAGDDASSVGGASAADRGHHDADAEYGTILVEDLKVTASSINHARCVSGVGGLQCWGVGWAPVMSNACVPVGKCGVWSGRCVWQVWPSGALPVSKIAVRKPDFEGATGFTDLKEHLYSKGEKKVRGVCVGQPTPCTVCGSLQYRACNPRTGSLALCVIQCFVDGCCVW